MSKFHTQNKKFDLNSNSTLKAKVVILRKLKLFKPVFPEPQAKKVIHLNKFDKVKSDEFYGDSYFRFPVIVMGNGQLWEDGCLFLLSFLKGFKKPPHRTLENKAYDVQCFLNWTKEEEIDYLAATKSALTTPLARFQRHMGQCVAEDYLSASLALRRFRHIQEFYKWLIKEGKCAKFRTEIGTPAIINSKRRKIEYSLTQKTKAFSSSSPKHDTIIDEGICRPLSAEDQTILHAVLTKLDNPEMLLSFLLALTTGGRMLSIFTLRENNFSTELSPEDEFRQVEIGANYLVDNKNEKNMLLTIPAWLYKRVQVYLRSQRRNIRKQRLKGTYHTGEQYVFITSRGNPYFYSRSDPNRFDSASDCRGGSVRKFIANQLLPKMQEANFTRELGFHDLRATYGVNLVHLLMKQLDKKIIGQDDSEFFYILNFVRQRMGHASIITTMRYLRFRTDQTLFTKIQENYEAFLFGYKNA